MSWLPVGSQDISIKRNKMEKTESRIPDWKTLIEIREADL